ncbi:MAG TPA: cation:proton antiporter [bacterium]|nr:cation:proton antiporter [bacterium]
MLHLGPRLPGGSPPAGTGSAFGANLRDPLTTLLLQVIVIVALAKALGQIFLRIGQPTVTGEIMAGILLGPSVLGSAFPSATAFLFPPSSMGGLGLLSQIGVILFMFAVGMDLDIERLRGTAQTAVLVSHASMVVPFSLGTVLALVVYRSMAAPHVAFTAFALFMGVAMSITALPVLARIVEERGLSKSPPGVTALAAAAVGDASAWCILAVIVPIVRAKGLLDSAMTIVLLLAFAAMMLLLIKPAAGRLVQSRWPTETFGKGLIAGALVFAVASALFTQTIGVHALFGAFLAGVAMPSYRPLRALLKEQLETFGAVLLLPLYFAFTGLRMRVGLLSDWQSWLACAAIIAVAVAGKMGAGTAAARWTRMSWLDSLSVGALMNTRGLVELIVLNIGYDLGILPPKIFAMLVLMALVTTFMTGPLLSLFGFLERVQQAVRARDTQAVPASLREGLRAVTK